jgi:hypothetical protein
VRVPHLPQATHRRLSREKRGKGDGEGCEPEFADAATGPARCAERFLQRYEAANTAFVNGDPGPWLSITAEKDPASIFGGFGGLGDVGVGQVHQRYLLAAGAFRPSGTAVDFEYLVKDVRGKRAYTVDLQLPTPRQS